MSFWSYFNPSFRIHVFCGMDPNWKYTTQAVRSATLSQVHTHLAGTLNNPCEKLKRNENKNSEFFLNLRTTLGRWCVELDYRTVVGISFLRNVKPNLVHSVIRHTRFQRHTVYDSNVWNVGANRWERGGHFIFNRKKGEKTHLPTARYRLQADRNARIMGLSFDGWINRTAPITFAVKFCLKSSKLWRSLR